MAYGNAPQAGPPGWGGWMPPPPPKPGVIPLAPLGLGDVLGGAFATVGRCWKQLFGIALTVYGAGVLVIGAALALAYAAMGDHVSGVFDVPSDQEPSWDDARPLLIAFLCVWVLSLVVLTLANAMLQACCPAILQDAVIGRRVTFGTVWRRAWSRVPAVLGTVFLTSLIGLVPAALAMAFFVLLVLALVTQDGSLAAWALLPLLGAVASCPAAVWLWVKFLFAPAAAVLERQGPIAAMRRSSQLVRGDWWRIFGISLLAAIIAAGVGYVVQLPLNFLGALPGTVGTSELGPELTAGQAMVAMVGMLIALFVGQMIGQIFSATFPQLVNSLLYVDQRIRKENLAPALAEAAAVPPTAPTAAAAPTG
ncbi:hypothetical protein OG883_20675 [Streptomyces sp. NBC_01142]|uniref:DUF7847 domain-containing protein n=1 Tax=Streptomyces sp. NBC_01142 TaxID=2975865 RepID=UPI002257BFCD|nr:hypothetical protein [Streptomyces sp. NBC_01142]MCX4822257.1 hypothetical protein [Streptomyces sp. NBC_01142]